MRETSKFILSKYKYKNYYFMTSSTDECNACQEFFQTSRYWREIRSRLIKDLRDKNWSFIIAVDRPVGTFDSGDPQFRTGMKCLAQEAGRKGWKTSWGSDYQSMLRELTYKLEVEQGSKASLENFPTSP